MLNAVNLGTGLPVSANSKMMIGDLKTGEMRRPQSFFRKFISREPGAEFPPESGRYHLYISLACPWACRCYIFLQLKGLEDAIGMTVTKALFKKTRQDSLDDHYGWEFASHEGEEAGAQPDTLNEAKFVRDLYDMADPNARGRYSVPILWDKKKKTIVNNESSEIIKMFNDEFNEYAKHPEVDLFPPHLRSSIDEVDSWTYNTINNGVYRCGFATTQSAYNQAAHELFESLDKCEAILSKQRYIAGNEFTEADVRLFVTFIRFDAKPSYENKHQYWVEARRKTHGYGHFSPTNGCQIVHIRSYGTFTKNKEEVGLKAKRSSTPTKYTNISLNYIPHPHTFHPPQSCIDEVYFVHFKCSRKAIREYPNLLNYTKDIYQIPGITNTVNMDHIKNHYYGSHSHINRYGIVPLEPIVDYSSPHDRDRFSSKL